MLIFLAINDTSIRQSMINRWFDNYIKLRLNDDSDAKKASEKLIFLDFDNRSMRDLERAGMTPRNKIADLLKRAYEGGAKLVFIDIDFSERDYTPEKFLPGDETPLSGLMRDKILFELLAKIKDDVSSDMKVLLPVTTYADMTQKNNIFMELIDNKKIYGVTAAFTVSSQNSIVRFWLPYLETKDILWSVPILSMVLTCGKYDELESIKKNLLEGSSEAFTLSKSENKFTFYRESSQNNGLLRDSQHHQYNRIQYAILPQNVDAGKPFGNISPNQIGHWRKKYGIDNRRINYHDKIVIIGRADDDCADFHETPVGRMSGMYVHANSIATVLGDTQPHLMSLCKYVIIEEALVILASCIFLFLNSSLAICIVAMMTCSCWFGTYWYFKFSNEFIYTSFAFAGLWIYRLLNKLRKFCRFIFNRKVK